MKIVVYVLPHQDDEAFVIPKIRMEATTRVTQFVFFLTKSAVSSALARTREGESSAFLQSLGIPQKNISFIGASLSIFDGTVIDNFLSLKSALIDAVRTMVSSTMSQDIEFVTTAFEGGHHDHDAAYVLTRYIANEFNAETKEVFLYNSHRRPGKLYRVASPFGKGAYETYPYTFADFCCLLKVPFTFKSQWKAMLGLWPILLIKALVSPLKLRVTPTSNDLDISYKEVPMYEKWGRTTVAEFNAKLNGLQKSLQEQGTLK